MAVIHMGKSSTKAWNPNRPMSSLLAWQVEHLHEAEKRLPHHHHTDIYVNAIKTEGEVFIGQIYNKIKENDDLWKSTALLIVYDEHGGIYDHVQPPACVADKTPSSEIDPGTGKPFAFDRLGVRVPAVLVSPWIPRGTVVDRLFDHASIPATVTRFFLKNYSQERSPRELEIGRASCRERVLRLV